MSTKYIACISPNTISLLQPTNTQHSLILQYYNACTEHADNVNNYLNFQSITKVHSSVYHRHLPASLFVQNEHNLENTRMWANAQRDGRPAKHRWRPLFNAAKFG